MIINWDGVAKQLQEMANELALECDVHPLNINITSHWDWIRSAPRRQDWTMSWVVTIITTPYAGRRIYKGKSNTPMGACLKAREAFQRKWGHVLRPEKRFNGKKGRYTHE